MTELEQFLVALIGELAADLAPMIEKLIAGVGQGKSPLQILADEDLDAILPPQWKTVVTMAMQKARYAGEPDPKSP